VKVPVAPSAEIALPPEAGVNWAVPTVIDGLVFAGLVLSVRSEAVTVKLPFVLNPTLKFCVPPTSAELGGSVAVASLAVIPTVSVAVLTRFQVASTAFTVTLKLVKAV